MLPNLTSSLIRVQPVAPESKDWSDIFGEMVGSLIGTALAGVFLWLALGAAHDLVAVVPVANYWQALGLVLGLQTVGNAVQGSAWKWARR